MSGIAILGDNTQTLSPKLAVDRGKERNVFFLEEKQSVYQFEVVISIWKGVMALICFKSAFSVLATIVKLFLAGFKVLPSPKLGATGEQL